MPSLLRTLPYPSVLAWGKKAGTIPFGTIPIGDEFVLASTGEILTRATFWRVECITGHPQYIPGLSLDTPVLYPAR